MINPNYINIPILPYYEHEKWNVRFIELAEHFSTWSRDPSTKIGAIAISESKQILSIGYNGFPRGIEDSEERLNDRETKYKFVVHAEKNLIYNATLNGVSLKNSNLYVFGLPCCGECAKAVIQVGIKKICCGFDGDYKDNWKESVEFAQNLFTEAKVDFTYYSRKENVWHLH